MDIQQEAQILGRKPVKCGAKDPSTCRYHGKKFTEQEQTVRRFLASQALAKRKADELQELKLKIEVDLLKNLKLRTLKDGTTVCSVYRSGVPAPPAKRGVEAESYVRFDKHVPEGRQGRTAAVFASPTLGGANRWVAGNSFIRNADLKVRELTIDIDNTYVYSVRAWEIASSKGDYYPDNEMIQKDYWDTGITMRQWLENVKAEPDKYDPRDWELLVPETGIKGIKPVSGTRTAAYNYSNYESDRKEILDLLK